MSKQERQNRNKDKAGVNVQLWARRNVLELPDDWSDMSISDRDEWIGGVVGVDVAAGQDPSTVAYIPAAPENEGIRKVQDAKDWMEETDFKGTVMAIAHRSWGQDHKGQLTRAEQVSMVIS